MSNTFHLSLDVPDLDEAVAFYRELFGVEPAKSKPGYAKFELADPPVALALQQASKGALSHLGIRVESTDEVVAASTRLAEAGLARSMSAIRRAATPARTRCGSSIRPGTGGRSTRCSRMSRTTTSPTTTARLRAARRRKKAP